MVARLLTRKPDILLAYDDLRRRQHQALLRLLDLLPRVEGLPPEFIEQARDATFHADHPFLLALIGPFGVGKSSLINALLGADVLETGPVPTTNRIVVLRHGERSERLTNRDGSETLFHPAELLQTISLVDTPGLESVFAEHGARTDAFLHRADWVVFVMLATQALTAGNLDYLAALRDYGKRVLVVVNQVDLLDDEQRATVTDFVREQCREQLQTTPEVFLVSARQGLSARLADPPDEAGWQASGMAGLESFIAQSLDDQARLRQKLETPLRIASNVLDAAQAVVQTNRQALDAHRSVRDNIDAQIAAARADQHELVEAALLEVAGVFAETAERADEAIRELFQPSRALSHMTGGIGELIGLAGLARRFGGGRSRAAQAFAAHDVLTPLDDLPKLVSDIGPRLESRDLQDLDDLALYTNDALDDLPEALRGKVIGEVHPPATYNREPLRRIRDDLKAIVNEARQVETARLDRAVRNALIMLAGWEVAVVIALALLGSLAIDWSENPGLPVLLIVGALALMLTGLAFMPLRGTLLAREHTARLQALTARYQDTVREAAAEQIEYGARLREDVAAPFTRLIRAQTTLHEELAGELRGFDDELKTCAGEIGRF